MHANKTWPNTVWGTRTRTDWQYGGAIGGGVRLATLATVSTATHRRRLNSSETIACLWRSRGSRTSSRRLCWWSPSRVQPETRPHRAEIIHLKLKQTLYFVPIWSKNHKLYSFKRSKPKVITWFKQQQQLLSASNHDIDCAKRHQIEALTLLRWHQNGASAIVSVPRLWGDGQGEPRNNRQ